MEQDKSETKMSYILCCNCGERIYFNPISVAEINDPHSGISEVTRRCPRCGYKNVIEK
jgi:DNA-directed RNA polymerase subunit RPC12/RpoP